MIYQALLSLSLALAASASAQTSLPPCCTTVKVVVYEHPKAAYPKDVRQYTYVKKTVDKVVCKGMSGRTCCCAMSDGPKG